MSTLQNVDLNNLQNDPDGKYKDMMKRRDDAKELFVTAVGVWKEIRKLQLDDLRFYRGKQWDSAYKTIGRLKKEPTIEVNMLPNFVMQVQNALWQMDISMSVHELDEYASKEVAKIYDGFMRHIEARSHAKSHYIHVVGENGALVPGFGFLKVEIDYPDPESFDEEITITSAYDPFHIIPDPSAIEPDMRDANYWFEIFDYTYAEYKRMFPRSTMSSVDLSAPGMELADWTQNKQIRVCRYWYYDCVDYIKYLCSDGSVVSELEGYTPETEVTPEDTDDNDRIVGKHGDVKIVSRKRSCVKKTVKWMDFNGIEILSEGTWRGAWLPFSAVIGPQSIVDGKRDMRGIIRFAKDTQKMLNYAASSLARRVGSSNKAPWVADMNSIKPYKAAWQTSNTENWSILPYDAYRKEKDKDGVPLQNPVPQRADQTAQIQDLLSWCQKLEDDLKRVIGIFDAGLGATPNEQSGVAIKTLAQQGQESNMHFSHNMVRGIEHLGEIIIDLIPKVYDQPRAIRIVNPDSTQEIVLINQIFTDKKTGKQKNHQLGVGKYGVVVNTGPAYATKNQQAIEQMLEYMRIDPSVSPVLRDILVGRMSFPGSEIVQERLVKLFNMLYPQIASDSDQQMPIPPQAQAQMQALHTLVQQLTQEMTLLQQEYDKERLLNKTDAIKTQGKIQVENVTYQHEKELELLRAKRDETVARIEQRTELVKDHVEHIEKMFHELLPHLTKQQGDDNATDQKPV